jgi:chloramphenicol-sensitive protein RarD
MTEAARGVLAMAAACTIWGLSGLFFKTIAAVPPAEVLAHRTLWASLFFGVVLLLQGRTGEIRAAVARPRTWLAVASAALLVAFNWFVFVYAIQTGHALEASLGYYVFPLVAVALGYLALGERFDRAQAFAIALALAAVALLTIGLGTPPWIALALALSFGGYGLVKNRLGLGPVLGVFLETALLAPLAIVWLAGLHIGLWSDPGGRPGAVFGQDAATSVMLLLSGPLMTGTPLILFSFAARRIRLATLGLVQYLNPSLQFLVAVLVFGEAFTPWHALAFPLIWIGLALYSRASLRQDRATRSRAISAGTVS